MVALIIVCDLQVVVSAVIVLIIALLVTSIPYGCPFLLIAFCCFSVQVDPKVAFPRQSNSASSQPKVYFLRRILVDKQDSTLCETTVKAALQTHRRALFHEILHCGALEISESTKVSFF